MKEVSLIIIIYNDKFLLFKRSKHDHKFSNMYGFVGGSIEDGETPEEAAIREAQEEINLDLSNIKHLKRYSFKDTYLNVFYIILDDISDIKLNQEHTRFDTFTLEELSNNPEVIPTTPKIINDYLDKSNLIKELYGSFDGNDDILSDDGDVFSAIRDNGTSITMNDPIMDESGTDRYTSDYGVGDSKYGVYNVEHDNDNADNFSNDELLERRTAWINGSKGVNVKQKCRLGGGTTCNQGDMNNLEFTKLSLNEEEIPEFIDVNGIKRSTLNSEGRIISPTINGIINFWKWFNNSKIVDDNGRPLICYHGTGSDFEKFNKRKAHDNEGRKASVGYGKNKFYFLTTSYGASSWAERSPERGQWIGKKISGNKYGSGENPSVMPVYIKLLNPITPNDYDIILDKCTEISRDICIEKLDNDLKNKNIDGLFDMNMPLVVAFNSNNIKSATGNNGNFNNSNNIINEDINASEAYMDDGVIRTIIQGRKGTGMVSLTPDIKDLIIQNNLNVIKVIPEHHNMYVVYKDQRDKALALYNYLKEHNGYLSDRTPEQAWEIGKLLDYSDDSIKKFIRRVYVDKVDTFGRKYSNDRVHDDLVVDPKFLDEEPEPNNSCKEVNITPEIIEYVSKFDSSEKLLRSGGIPIELLDKAAYGFTDTEITQLLPKHLNIKWKDDLENVIYEQEKSGLSKIDWARNIDLSEPIEVSYNGKKFFIEDGHHRYYAAKILKKLLNVELEIKANPIIKLGDKMSYDQFHRCVWNQAHNKENLDEYYNYEYGDDRYDDNGNYINIEKKSLNKEVFSILKEIIEARRCKRFDQKIYKTAYRKLTTPSKSIHNGKKILGDNAFTIAMNIYDYLPKISWDEYQKNGLGLDNYIEEGVGDKYAEKKFGIPDQDTIFNDLYKSSKEKEANKPVAISYGRLKTSDTEKSPIEIYKNPKSLDNFGIDVRAIGDSYGNLYVAVHNGYINHANIGNALGFGNEVDESPTKYVLLHRIKYTNSFGLSDTSEQDYQTHYSDEIINLIKGVKKRNPQYNFFTSYYLDDYKGKPIEEGVGDKYLKNKFNIEPEFADFEQKYKEKKIKDEQENIVYQDKNLTIIANPKSLKNIGRNVRGIIDRNGNLYVEAQSYTIHDGMIIKLSQKGLIKHIDDWHLVLPTDFITVIRDGNKNKFYLGESNETMMPDEDRYENIRTFRGKNYKIPPYMKSVRAFQQFLDKAKQKNPKIEFVNEMVRYFGINENILIINNIDEARKLI